MNERKERLNFGVELLEQYYRQPLPSEYKRFIKKNTYKKYQHFFYVPDRTSYLPEIKHEVVFYKKTNKKDPKIWGLSDDLAGLPETVLLKASRFFENEELNLNLTYLPFASFPIADGYVNQFSLIDTMQGKNCPVLLWNADSGIKRVTDSIADFLKILVSFEEFSPYNILKHQYEEIMKHQEDQE